MKYYFAALMMVVSLLIFKVPALAGFNVTVTNPDGTTNTTNTSNQSSNTENSPQTQEISPETTGSTTPPKTSPQTSSNAPSTTSGNQQMTADLTKQGLEICKNRCTEVKSKEAARCKAGTVPCCISVSNVVCMDGRSATNIISMVTNPTFLSRLASLDPTTINSFGIEAGNTMYAMRCGEQRKSSNNIMSFIFGIGGAIIGGVVGGPGGVAAGYSIGSGVGSFVDGLTAPCSSGSTTSYIFNIYLTLIT